MFEIIYKWLQNLSFYMILVNAVTCVLPSSSYRKYIRFFTGLILILMLAMPVMSLFGTTIDTIKYDNFEIDDWMDVNGKIEVEDIVIEP